MGPRLLKAVVASMAALCAGTASGALIEIGSAPQLFLDDYLIESLSNARRVLNHAEKVVPNPVVYRTEPWEGNSRSVKYVEYDETRGEFRMWYLTGSVTSRPVRGPTAEDRNPAGRTGAAEGARFDVDDDPGAKQFHCYATSKDGIHWRKPALGLYTFQGSTKNNIIPPENPLCALKMFVRDDHTRDAARRYVGLERFASADPEIVKRMEARLGNDPSVYYRMEDQYVDELKRKKNWSSVGYNLYFSPDGMTWTPFEKNPIFRDAPQTRWWAGPTTWMGWDPIRRVYAIHMEATQHSRSTYFARLVGRSESHDLVQWTYPETIVVPDPQDPPGTQFYRSPVVTYGGIYIALLNMYYTMSGEILPTVASSRDGIHYDRTFRDPFIRLGSGTEFDAREIYPKEPIVHGENVYIFYTGRVMGHGRGVGYERMFTASETESAIGLAILPRDGFVSIDAANRTTGVVVTRAFSFSGGELFVRAKGGTVKIQLLAGAHHMIPGHTMEEADPLPTTGKMERVTWQGRADLRHLAGKPVKLKIQLSGSKLYSFQFK